MAFTTMTVTSGIHGIWGDRMSEALTLDRDTNPAAAAEARRAVVADARAKLEAMQREDGHIVFELEADTTIPSEYILLKHFLDEIDLDMEARIGRYLRRHQGKDDGWPLFHDGDMDISASIKAYWALKIIGDDIDAPHMKRAREAILAKGGAARANVFTRIAMALYGDVPWRAVPVMPVEIMLLPLWFPFHMSKIAYWSRTVIAPLLVLAALKPRARNPRGVTIRELFITPPEQEKVYNINPTGSFVGECFLVLDKVLRFAEPYFPKGLRQRAIDKAVAFYTERLNGEDGLGAIYPAMANAVMAYDALGYAKDHPDLVIAKKSIEKLVVKRGDEVYCQPCVSPVWDTSLAAHALMEAGAEPGDPKLKAALDWLKDRQILDVKGDWIVRRPDVRPGGWAFQYNNDYYPDVDDTAVVAMAMHRTGDPAYKENIDRAAEWIIGMQSASGGWGAFEPENEHFYLNSIPFADHGALLDPPTEDVTARCLGFLAQIGYERGHPVIDKGVNFLKRFQQEDGSWFGRWGANYIYGTWSVLCALNAVGEDMDQEYIRRAVDWLKARQRPDGGWGEDLVTYEHDKRDVAKASVPSQTAWAVLGLMAAGEVESEEVRRGVAFLQNHPREGARWDEKYWTGTGFPRVFYLKYHGYAAYFPLWAMARYDTLMKKNNRRVEYGM
jgi:squalene-hopene/tetraprenyl-beta-curcumene cyclase